MKNDIKSFAQTLLNSAAPALPVQARELPAAIYLAETLFADKTDKAGKPYIGHLQRVAGGVRDDLKPAAFMHDLIEDIEGWTFDDLKEIGFSDYTLDAIRAVTKIDGGHEPYFDAMQRVGLTPQAIPLKRSDLKDNSNIFRFENKPLMRDFERVTKYFFADKYLADIESGKTAPGTPVRDWMAQKPETLQDFALVEKESSPKLKTPGA